jgi:hypothetical protein
MPQPTTFIRFCRCHSVGSPSIVEYWHIGEIAIRFGATSGPDFDGCEQRSHGEFLRDGPFEAHAAANRKNRYTSAIEET